MSFLLSLSDYWTILNLSCLYEISKFWVCKLMFVWSWQKWELKNPCTKSLVFFQLCCSQYFLDKDSLLSSNFWTLIEFYKKWSCFWLRKVGTIRQDGHLHLQFVKMSKCIRFFLCICLKKCVQLMSYWCFYALLVALY